MARSALFVVASLCICAIINGEIFPKHLAGPPSEFPLHQLPQPQDGAQLQQSAFIPMWVTSKDTSFDSLPQDILWKGTILVDSATEFQLSYLSPIADQTTLIFTDPHGNVVQLGSGNPGQYPIGGTAVPETTWIIQTPVVGAYTLQVQSNDAVRLFRSAIVKDDIPLGYAMILNESPLSIFAHLTTYNMQEGQQVGLVATLVETSLSRKEFDLSTAKIFKDSVLLANMVIQTPQGSDESVKMHDDGLHMDGAADDGIYGALISATETGTYQAQAVFKGQTADGTLFLRTTQHLIASVPDDISLEGTASGAMSDPQHLKISLNVAFSAATIEDESKHFRTYAEVWGKDITTGLEVAVAWIGGMAKVENDVLNMVLDTDWLSLANAQAPLTLQNVIIQDTKDFVPVATAASIPVTMNAVTNAMVISSRRKVTEITKEMKQGVKPARFNKTGAGNSGVVLVHGYCSDTNPWAPYPSDWTSPYFFLKASSSLGHDEFAKLVLNYIDVQNLESFALVGHSQGGIVSTHILNYYFSGLENAASGRLIQSIGTPYAGCSAAGSSANLGELFGIGCGENFDLSLDGSALWIPGITADTRSQVYFYTTTYSQGGFFGDYCNLAINMILEWPNDGTCEFDYSNLGRGSNNMGNTQKQCHITDMKYPAQYYDHNRNQVMNANAAR